MRFGWTEKQIDETDPDLIDELLTFVRAERDQREYEAKEARRKRRE